MQTQANQGFLDRFFKLREKNTTVKTEVLAGLTTFIALAYIIFVNPNILSEAGIPKEAAIASTIWIAALSTMVMGVFANYPVALAPGMGLNAFFAYYVCGTLGLHWTVALGAVFFSGVLFLILTVSHIRQAIINSVPQNLRVAISVGIGLFIAFIGLKGTGLIIPDKATFIGLGHVTDPTTMLSLFGLVLTGALMARNIQGSILIGIIVTTLLSMVLGYSPVPHAIGDVVSTSLPHMGETFGKLDIAGAWNYGIVSIIFTFTVVELVDNMGTLIGLTSKAKLIKPNGEIENLDRALTTDAVGTICSSIFGTSTVTSYIESAAGIAAGGKTGLTAVTVSICFLIALLFAGLCDGSAADPRRRADDERGRQDQLRRLLGRPAGLPDDHHDASDGLYRQRLCLRLRQLRIHEDGCRQVQGSQLDHVACLYRIRHQSRHAFVSEIA